MQTRCHKFIATLCILKEIFTHFAVLSKTLQHGEPSSAALLSAVSYCLAKLDDILRRKDEILATQVMTWQRMENLAWLESKSLKQVLTSLVV